MPSANLKANVTIIVLLLLTAFAVIFYGRSLDDKPIKPIVAEPRKVLTMQAAAFCSYGWDENGIDYGPGYCIVSTYSDIPLYSLLEIDQYGEGQVIATSDTLKANEIQVWYNSPSKVRLFGQQEVQVKILGEGDKPCPTIE